MLSFSCSTWGGAVRLGRGWLQRVLGPVDGLGVGVGVKRGWDGFGCQTKKYADRATWERAGWYGERLASSLPASNSFHRSRMALKRARVGWTFRLELPARLCAACRGGLRVTEQGRNRGLGLGMNRTGLAQSAAMVVAKALTKAQDGGAQAEQRQWPGMVISRLVCWCRARCVCQEDEQEPDQDQVACTVCGPCPEDDADRPCDSRAGGWCAGRRPQDRRTAGDRNRRYWERHPKWRLADTIPQYRGTRDG